MKTTPTAIPDVLIIEPKVFGDERGFFYESFNQQRFEQATGVHCNFVQNSHSRSARNVLRGLHYQIQQPQGKLVRVVAGEIFDVVVDIRKSSPTFGRWVGLGKYTLAVTLVAWMGYAWFQKTRKGFADVL